MLQKNLSKYYKPEHFIKLGPKKLKINKIILGKSQK